MPSRHRSTAEQRQRRSAQGLLVAAIGGLIATFLSGVALVPRVQLVEVCILVASAVGAGAALTAAVLQRKHSNDRSKT